jgi:colanic acid/amylovoran biosynthesis glycosyltransferase
MLKRPDAHARRATRPMELLIVGVKWPPETFIRLRLERLARCGFKVVVASSQIAGKGTVSGNIRLARLPSLAMTPARRALALASGLVTGVWRSPVDAWRVLKSAGVVSKNRKEWVRWMYRLLPFCGLRPDVVHFEWNLTAAGYLPLFDLLGCPVVVSCRGSQLQIAPHNPERRAEVSGIRATFERAAVVHCVSEAIQEIALTHGLDKQKCRIIRPAVDVGFFRPGSVPRPASGRFSILMTGKVSWVKGHEYALMALRRLIDSGVDAELTIVGRSSGADHQRLLFSIQDLNLNSRVHLRGAVEPAGVRAALEASDVFLLASVSEGISNAALEAMACGVPVVSTDVGGMREAITDGTEGFLVAPRDAESMAMRLEYLAHNPQARVDMGRAARMRIERDFSLDRQIEQWMELYGELMKRKENAVPAGEFVETSGRSWRALE